MSGGGPPHPAAALMALPRIDDPGRDWKGARVLVRSDLNVPLEGGRITDAARIEASVPTIRELLKRGGGGRRLLAPGSTQGGPYPELSLAPCAEALGQALGAQGRAARDCVGPDVAARVAALKPGEVVMLENVRFHAGEEANDAGLRRAARLGLHPLRQRRLRGGPPRPRLDRGRRARLLPELRRAAALGGGRDPRWAPRPSRDAPSSRSSAARR